MVFSEPDDMVSSEPEEKPVVVKKDDVGKKETAPSETKAEMLARCVKATVKIHVRRANGVGVGAGFIIDKEKGWVVTNHHVIENAVLAEAEFDSGASYRIEGEVIVLRRCDLAIVKLADMPITATAMSIVPDSKPALADDVFAIGAPSGLAFTTTPGAVARLLDTSQMPPSLKAEVRRHMQDEGNLDWVQHTAKISPGNSGGPLINIKGQVIGINTLVVAAADMSFAVDVRHLQELLKTAPAGVTKRYGFGAARVDPPPKPVKKKQPDPPPRVEPKPKVQPQPKPKPKPAPNGFSISPQEIRQLAEVNAARNWSPETAEQYAQLQNLARMITIVQSSPEIAKLPAAARAALVQESQKALTQLSEFAVQASDAQIKAVNRFAVARINSPGVGAFFYANVPQQHLNKNAENSVLFLKMTGVDHFVVIPVTKQFDKIKIGSRWLVLGVRGPRNYRLTIVSRGQQKVDSYGIQTKQLLLVKK